MRQRIGAPAPDGARPAPPVASPRPRRREHANNEQSAPPEPPQRRGVAAQLVAAARRVPPRRVSNRRRCTPAMNWRTHGPPGPRAARRVHAVQRPAFPAQAGQAPGEHLGDDVVAQPQGAGEDHRAFTAPASHLPLFKRTGVAAAQRPGPLALPRSGLEPNRTRPWARPSRAHVCGVTLRKRGAGAFAEPHAQPPAPRMSAAAGLRAVPGGGCDRPRDRRRRPAGPYRHRTPPCSAGILVGAGRLSEAALRGPHRGGGAASPWPSWSSPAGPRTAGSLARAAVFHAGRRPFLAHATIRAAGSGKKATGGAVLAGRSRRARPPDPPGRRRPDHAPGAAMGSAHLAAVVTPYTIPAP